MIEEGEAKKSDWDRNGEFKSQLIPGMKINSYGTEEALKKLKKKKEDK